MEASRLSKSCPYCRLRFKRTSNHIRNIHAAFISPSQHREDQKHEKDRALAAGEESMSIIELQRDFPPNYLDVALMLMNINIPVYIPVTDTYVHHFTPEDIYAFKEDPASMPDPLKYRTQPPTLKYKNNPAKQRIPPLNFTTSAELATTTYQPSATTQRPPAPDKTKYADEQTTPAPTTTETTPTHTTTETTPAPTTTETTPAPTTTETTPAPTTTETTPAPTTTETTPAPTTTETTPIHTTTETPPAHTTSETRPPLPQLDQSTDDKPSDDSVPEDTSNSTSSRTIVRPTPSSQSSTSTPSSIIAELMTTRMTTKDKLKALIGEITTETPLTSRKDIERYLEELHIVCDDPKPLTKQMQSYVLYYRNLERGKEIAHALRRLQDKNTFKAAITKYITDKRWSANIKTSQSALRLLQTAHEDKLKQKKVNVTPTHNTVRLEEKLKQKIKDQHWPLIIILTDRVKGKCAYARRDIPKGTILCDYHGEIISKEVGKYRYDQLYKERSDNDYMIKFHYAGKHYYCDAVKECECHPNKKQKGRYINHSRNSPNVKLRARPDDDTIVLLFETTKDIYLGDELFCKYGCHSDPKSDKQD